jgi:hypothetical protein
LVAALAVVAVVATDWLWVALPALVVIGVTQVVAGVGALTLFQFRFAGRRVFYG